MGNGAPRARSKLVKQAKMSSAKRQKRAKESDKNRPDLPVPYIGI
jgi:hypothetical protein